MEKYKDYLFNHEYKLFTCEHPQNTFIIDYSNGYPVKVTTNVTKNTKWSDIFKGNYDYANPDGTPEYLSVNGIKYTYIDMKYAERVLKYDFVHLESKYNVERWKSKFQEKTENFFKKIA